jgi:1,4-dihydroxy-2-naphthoyl-CoA synthase
MDFETITYSVEDRVATIAVNRPDQLNAVSMRMKDELVRPSPPPRPTRACGCSSSRHRTRQPKPPR